MLGEEWGACKIQSSAKPWAEGSEVATMEDSSREDTGAMIGEMVTRSLEGQGSLFVVFSEGREES